MHHINSIHTCSILASNTHATAFTLSYLLLPSKNANRESVVNVWDETGKHFQHFFSDCVGSLSCPLAMCSRHNVRYRQKKRAFAPFDPRSCSFSLSSTSKIFFSFFNVYIYLFALFVQLPISSLSCAGSSWLPLPLVSFPSFSLLPTPNRPCQSERSSKARHEADSFEPAEWSERLTPGQSGWLGAAAVVSIPALALSLFLQRLEKKEKIVPPTRHSIRYREKKRENSTSEIY